MTGPWTIRLGRSSRKALVALDRSGQRSLVLRIHRGLQALEQDPVAPRPGADIEPLKGQRGHFRLRVGDYRLKYVARPAERLVEVYEISPRRRAYR